MAIVEKKLTIIISISVILFFAYLITATIPADFAPEYNIEDADYDTGGNYTEVVEQGNDVIDSIGGVASAIFLQIPNAPVVVNIVMAFIAGILLFTLAFVFIAYARELIGLT